MLSWFRRKARRRYAEIDSLRRMPATQGAGPSEQEEPPDDLMQARAGEVESDPLIPEILKEEEQPAGRHRDGKKVRSRLRKTG
jgi:hypothetical protein